ncbi:hypothetical protein [Exiguobacterium antarcticum]|uniref:hypothetical protein n=1 Tax=Exiguobacterium antarcticum TaxID=132920 RepID=UPI0002FD802E|nr:hypothetical protein [Exiguobacterium antarcticum]
MHGHQQMMEHLHERSRVLRGKPARDSAGHSARSLFAIDSEIDGEHPGIELEIIEEGAFELKRHWIWRF